MIYPMREIPGFQSLYATHLGEIISCRSGAARTLKQRTDSHGYLCVTVRTDKGQRRQSVHRLVALAYHGVPGDALECRHLDGNKANCSQANLAWGTRRENVHDAKRHGTLGHGMLAHRRKLTPSSAKNIVTRVIAGEARKAVAAEYGIHPSYIKNLLRGEFWSESTGVGGPTSLEP